MNKEYKENQKPLTGKTTEAEKPVGDSPMKNDLAATSVTDDKRKVEKPTDDGVVKTKIEDAWRLMAK